MLFEVLKDYPYLRGTNSKANKEKEEIENTNNLKILDAILDDDEEQFLQLLSENCEDPSKANKTFNITNFKIPDILKDSPSYASLCACFSSEKCFAALSLFLPCGTASKEMKKLDNFKRSPIHFACIGGSLSIIRELEQSMFDLNARDKFGYFPSHYAAMAGHFDMIKYLYTKGADLTSPSIDFHLTPLQVACFHGNLGIVRFICETVIPNQIEKLKEIEGDTNLNESFHILKNCLTTANQSTPLHYACKGGHDNIVNYFLSKPDLFDLQINSLDSDSRSPLLCACFNGSLSCVKAILNGARGKIKLDMNGRKHLPLVDAAVGGYLDIVHYLIKNNQIEIKIQQETSENISALHAAVLNDHFDVAKFLIEHGAAKNLPEEKVGHIFLSAVEAGNFEMISYLDKELEIPYKNHFQVLQTTTQTSFHYRAYFEKDKYRNLSFGDRYMQQACLLESKEIVQFLLDRNCSFDFVDLTDVISEKSFPFIQFLVEKGFYLSCSKNSYIKPPIVKLIRIGNIELINEYIPLGVKLDETIIKKKRMP